MRPLFMNAWKKNLLEFTQNEVMGGITFHEHTDHKAFGFTAKICVNTSGQDLIEKVEFSSRDGYYTLEPHTIEDESYEFVAKSGDEPAILIGAPNLNYGCSTSSSMQFSFSG